MKRIIAVLLSAAMCICLFGACGGTGTGSVSDAPAEETVNPAIAGAGQPTAEPSDAENPSEPGDAPSQLDRSVHREISIGSTDNFSTGHFDVTAKLNNTYNCYSAFLAYDTLIYIDPETHQYKSDMLTEFYWDDDLPGVVLTLRDDVYFSNGDQMTTEDILFTYQRQTAADRQRDQFLIMLIDQAEISEDGLSIKIPFSQEYGPWRPYVGGNSGIMNKSWVEEHGGDNCDFYDPAMVCGSGPYKVTDFQIDFYTVYEKRDDWWMADEAPNGYATYDKITVYYYTDATTMMVDYEIGTIDVALGITEYDYNRVLSDPSKELFRSPLHPYTEGLLSAIPVPKINYHRERILLKGELSSPINPAPGCCFANRCPNATERWCTGTTPELREVAPDHFVACQHV